MTDFNVRMPMFGMIARNAKNFQPGRTGWMNAEEKLCNVYKKYVSQLPEAKFNQRIEYMKYAGDLGRTPMGMGMKLFLFVLVAAESMGFSYLLGTWAASDGTANLYTQLMYGIVFVLASILAMVTHKAGEQHYRTSLLRSNYTHYKGTGSTEDRAKKIIALSDNQFDDKDDPIAIRCYSRIAKGPDDRGNYSWSWVAGVFVAIIFVLSGVMRFSHMQAEQTRESQAVEATTSNPFTSSKLPTELVAPQQAADKKANAEARTDNTIEGSAAIVILGVIFVVTQIVGFGAGHKHCFAGQQTYKEAKGSNASWYWSEHEGAYADTWGYSTYDAYWEAMQPIKDIVNSRLKDLQQILNHNSPINLVLTKTFDDYLAFEAKVSRISKDAQNEYSTPGTSTPAAVAQEAAPAAPTVSPVEQAKRDIEAIADKAVQQTYFAKLTPEVRDALKPWLKERKEKAAAVVSQEELEDLF
ncbi:MAG: hypothetical protein JJD98_03280 [Polaromonas sp.]|nr:hypothetical protein [Polaromonas sp.]